MRHDRSPAVRQAERELEAALDGAARTGDRHESRPSLVRRVYNEEIELIRIVQKPWTLERMEMIARRLERKAAVANQFVLPGINLPPVIKLLKPDPTSKKKQQPQRIPLLDFTLPQLVEYRAELLQGNKRVIEVDKAIALMRKHTRSKKATLREVLEKHGQEILNFEDAKGATS